MSEIETFSPNVPKSVIKMRTYRQRMRDSGLRPIQLWIPDTRSEHFKQEARRQSLEVRDSDAKVLDFIEQVEDW